MISTQTYYQLILGIVKPDKSGPAGDISEPCPNNPHVIYVCAGLQVCVSVHLFEGQTAKVWL